MAKLFLVRHGKSEWNKLGQWTGWTDVHLALEGETEARKAGEMLWSEDIHTVHTSELVRTHETFEHLKHAAGKGHLTHTPHKALNERHYGIHTGKNKWQVKEEIGEEAFQAIRRGWNTPIPDGETLKDVYERVVPYFQERIEPELREGQNVLIVAHGNTLRALVKYLEHLNESQVAGVEIETGEVYSYTLDETGAVTKKEILKKE